LDRSAGLVALTKLI